MFRKTISILILITILLTSFSAITVNAKTDLTTKLKENIIPLKTTQAGNGFEDLKPLNEILKDKKIIAMGEATHGTKEFFEMKHRMFEFLVEEMGYRVFAIEAEFGGSQIVNDYILHGKGSIGESLDAMNFWIWNTQEVVDMIEWMKEYNEKPENKSKIRFYGFDIQSIDNDKEYIKDYLEKVNLPSKDSFKDDNSSLEDINNDLIENKSVYIERSSLEEYDLILQHMVLINQYNDFHNENAESKNAGFEIRDDYMTENVKWILDYESKYYGNDNIMLWAHNGHVSKDYYGLKTIGRNLKEIYGGEYYAMGFDFYKGSFVALPITFYGKVLRKLSKFHISSSPTASYSDEMRKTNIPISFLDVKNAEQDELLSDFLSSQLYVNNVTAAYPGKPHNMNETIVKNSFDGMIFVESTEEAKRADTYTDKVENGKGVLMGHYFFIIVLLVMICIVSYSLYKRKFK